MCSACTYAATVRFIIAQSTRRHGCPRNVSIRNSVVFRTRDSAALGNNTYLITDARGTRFGPRVCVCECMCGALTSRGTRRVFVILSKNRGCGADPDAPGDAQLFHAHSVIICSLIFHDVFLRNSSTEIKSFLFSFSFFFF